MLIDTRTKCGMLHDICRYYQLTEREFWRTLYEITIKPEESSNEDELLTKFNKITNTPKDKITELYFYHLSRRLNSCDDNETNNLMQLIEQKTGIISFLEEFNIKFNVDDDCKHVSIEYQGKTLSEEKFNDPECKIMFGHITDRLDKSFTTTDVCINGFALMDLIQNNDYYSMLKNGPELLIYLSKCLDNENLIKQFKKNSKYYCYIYKIPIKKAIFDKNENFTITQKRKCLIANILIRLNEYMRTNRKNYNNISDISNPILRLKDTDNINKNYYIDKIKLDV